MKITKNLLLLAFFVSFSGIGQCGIAEDFEKALENGNYEGKKGIASIIKYLQRNPSKVSSTTSDNGNTVLYTAIRYYNPEYNDYFFGLVSQIIEINKTNKKNLAEEQEQERKSIFETGHGRLIEATDAVRMSNNMGFAPLHAAAKRGLIKVADLLLKNGARPDINKKSYDIFQTRAGENLINPTNIPYGARPVWGGFSPLHFAIENNQEKFVDFLLDKEPRVYNFTDALGRTVFDLANNKKFSEGTLLKIFNLENKQEERAKKRISLKPLTPSGLSTEEILGQKLRNKKWKEATDLIETKKINWKMLQTKFYGQAMLVYLTSDNIKAPIKFIQYLIEKGAPVDQFSDRKFSHTTPLIHAVFNRHTKIVRLLLENGADPNLGSKDLTIDQAYSSPLDALLKKYTGFKETEKELIILELLIKYDAKLDSRRLFRAARKNWPKTIRLILNSNKIDVNSRGYGGPYGQIENTTALHIAARYGNLDIVKILVEQYGAKPLSKDGDGKTAHQVATDNKNFEVARYLEGKEKELLSASNVFQTSIGRSPVVSPFNRVGTAGLITTTELDLPKEESYPVGFVGRIRTPRKKKPQTPPDMAEWKPTHGTDTRYYESQRHLREERERYQKRDKYLRNLHSLIMQQNWDEIERIMGLRSEEKDHFKGRNWSDFKDLHWIIKGEWDQRGGKGKNIRQVLIEKRAPKHILNMFRRRRKKRK